MAQEWHIYNGGWKEVTDPYIYNSGWKSISEAYIYDGSGWKQFWAACNAILDDVTAYRSDPGAGTGCADPKCTACVGWNHTNGDDAEHHIRIQRSIGGGSFTEVADDLSVNNFQSGFCGGVTGDDGRWNDASCTDSNVQFRVRLENDGGDTLACGDSNNEKDTANAACAAS